MSKEFFILTVVTIFSITTVFYIPKDKYRLSFVSFFTFQTLTWAGFIILVELGKIEFPVRLFVRATRGGVVNNFLFFPMIFVWFVIIFERIKSRVKKVFHYVYFISLIVWYIKFIAEYTNLQNFLKGTPVSQIVRLYINFTAYFIVSHLFVLWFSKKAKLSELEGK